MVKNRAIFILSLALSILAWLVSPARSYAQQTCVSVNSAGACGGALGALIFSCTATTPGGLTERACCLNSQACQDFRNNLLSNAQNPLLGGSRPAWNPEGSCGKGIDTALGCLPYDPQGGSLGTTILTFLAGITGAIALVIMLMGTVQIMTAGGNPEQVQKGKELLTGAIMGLLFIVFSVTLLRLIAGDIIMLPGF